MDSRGVVSINWTKGSISGRKRTNSGVILVSCAWSAGKREGSKPTTPVSVALEVVDRKIRRETEDMSIVFPIGICERNGRKRGSTSTHNFILSNVDSSRITTPDFNCLLLRYGSIANVGTTGSPWIDMEWIFFQKWIAGFGDGFRRLCEKRFRLTS